MRHRNQDAWERFVRVYCPAIYAHCRKAGVDASEAADICQNVMLTVAKKIDSFHKDSPSDTFRGWLYRITANKIVDHFRKRIKEFPARGGSEFARYLHEIPDEVNADDSLTSFSVQGTHSVSKSSEPVKPNQECVVTNDSAQLIEVVSDRNIEFPASIRPDFRMALADLKATVQPRTWLIFEETVLNGRACEEVAKELGISAQSVRQAKYRFCKKFRETYGGLLDFD